MSKVFEDAYRELAKTDVPDLWDRIEAGLSEKSAPVTMIKEMDAAEKASGISEDSETRGQKKPAKIVTFMKRYATTAAALICVAILIPVVLTVGRFGIGGSKSESAAYEEAAPMEMAYEESAAAPAAEVPAAEVPAAEMFEEAAEAPAAEVYAEEAVEAPEAEAFADEEMYAEEEMWEAEISNGQMAGEGGRKMAVMEAEPAEAEEAEPEEEKEISEEAAKTKEGLLTEDFEEKIFYGNVKLKVIENSESKIYFEGTEAEEYGYICRMTVQEHSEGLLEEGEELQIFVSALSSYYYAENGVFVLDLEAFETDDGRYYTVKKYHTQTEK